MIYAHGSHLPSKSTERPLRSLIIDLSICVVYEIRIVLVQRVVGEMNISGMGLRGLSVLNSCKTSQSLFVYIDPQRINGSDGYIDPQVELVIIYQHRISYVLARYHALFLRNLQQKHIFCIILTSCMLFVRNIPFP